MVSQNTIDIINYTKDLDIEFNTKMFIFCVLLLYSLWFLYKTKDYEFTSISNAIAVGYGKIVSYIYIFNLPWLAIWFLFRGTLEQFIFFIGAFYSISYMVIFAFGSFWSWETVAKTMSKVLGLDYKSPKFSNYFGVKVKK